MIFSLKRADQPMFPMLNIPVFGLGTLVSIFLNSVSIQFLNSVWMDFCLFFKKPDKQHNEPHSKGLIKKIWRIGTHEGFS